DVTEALLSRDAAKVISDGEQMTAIVRQLLIDSSARAKLGTTAREFILTQQGATARTIDLLGRIMPQVVGASSSPLPSHKAA
ncbi:MAG: hypothetical protein SFV23_06225, partial [Planctomycetaceae bacterium]|nr:hypothetical protein [Planctomycetaceae bacterium]